ncbi:diguanylate cyclase [Scytonema hofmannii PCC 7110]|uniref:Adenylate cyclase n=1 Tax=Scytonema hofmannii PCC 7110 TaxID=128403 RepID=A0A139X4J4_9CYAN|nr:adenylate/guanylate cyclase domain-containing protein [Scytonema hofmannii]KYC39619.1 diguanylate cyclase [Scytonema hofmannii PCC 7110]
MNFSLNNKQKAEILVVYNTPTALDWLVSVLQKNNYEVHLANNGYSAIEIARTKIPDLILLDIVLSDMNGYSICQQLKASPQTSEISIIFTSGLNERLDIAKAFQVGGADYIIKPFQAEEVLARVHNQLSQRFLQKILQQQTKLLHQQNKQLQAEITERQLLQQKLFTSEKKMRTVLAAMTDIVIVIDITEEQINNIEIIPTQVVEKQNSNTDRVSQILEQFFQDETAETWLSLIQKALDTKETVNLDFCLNDLEKTVWLTAAISPMRDRSVILVARDINDRKLAEEALRIAEERYHSIVENAIVGIYQSTPDGRYISANQALANMYGYSCPEELIENVQYIGQQLYFDSHRRQQYVTEIETNDAVTGFESIICRKDGTSIWISETARGVRDLTGKLLYYEGMVTEITDRMVAQEALKFQQAQTEELLLNILPQPIAERLQAGESPIADRCEEVSVLFADLVGFTSFSTQKNPAEIVEVLNKIFSQFDRLAEKHNLEKIKTIGDAYMVVGGLPTPCGDSAQKTAQMALDMQACLAQFNAETTETFQVRIGINTGEVVAGVIGMTKFTYDLWGDTVNIASRMESNGLPGKIQVSAATYDRLKEQFEFEKRGKIAIKGKGEMMTYWLLAKARDVETSL